MKKLILILFIFYLSLHAAFCGETFGYKNIKPKTKIMYDNTNNTWSTIKKGDNYYEKTGLNDYLNPDGSFAFATGCEYEFLTNGKFLGHSNKDLKFFEFIYEDGSLTKSELDEVEVQKLFPNCRVIKLSGFSSETNSIKIKKNTPGLKLLILNDLNCTFEGYDFSSGNAKYELSPIFGIITVTKSGMIQFSPSVESSEQNRWYVILVR